MAGREPPYPGGHGDSVSMGYTGADAHIYGGKGEHLSVSCNSRYLSCRRVFPFFPNGQKPVRRRDPVPEFLRRRYAPGNPGSTGR